MMAEALFSDEDSGPSTKYFSSSSSGTAGGEQENFKGLLEEENGDNSVPLEDEDSKINGNSNGSEQIEQQITESLDQLSTKSEPNSDDSDTEQYRKKVRVGNHYQARIPKFLSDIGDCASEDELLWDPFIIDSESVENFLKRISSITKLLLPMGTHLRDDEHALYILQKNHHDVESAFNVITANSPNPEKVSVWSEEECRNFERGLLNFGKNFFLIQKYRVTTRHVSELVQFYYLWKKTERYDLFATRIRTGKKKYALNPGISDLMCRYLGTQKPDVETVATNVQFIVTESRKDVQENSQY